MHLALSLVLAAGAFVATSNPAEADEPRVGWIGCSNTIRVADEAAAVGVDDAFWPGRENGRRGHEYGGGVFWRWADETGEEWQRFVEYMDTYPDTQRVFWMMCNHYMGDTELSQEDIDDLTTIAQRVNQQYPQVVLYASGVHTAPECRRVGSHGIDVVAADWVSDGRFANVTRGPVLTTMVAGVTTIRDNCHQTTEGAAMQMADVAEFFLP